MITTTTQIAKQLRDVFMGDNWITSSNLKDFLAQVTWQEATTSVHGFNSIAKLTYHLGYYVEGVLNVLQGGTLDISDKFSFDLPPIQSQLDWENMQEKIWNNVHAFAHEVEQLPDSILSENFIDGKYGNYCRNLLGIIEHTHYHLGQMILIRKLVQATKND